MKVGLDLDGTVVDSRARHAIALERAASQVGVVLPEGLLARFVADKAEGLTGLAVLEGAGVPLPEEILQRWIALIESDELLAHDVLYPGVMAALERQWALGWRFHIVTARQNSEGAHRQVKRLGLEAVCTQVLVVPPGRHRSTEGLGAKAEAAGDLGLEAVIGDTEDDWRWARELGVGFFPVACGFRSAAFWHGRGLAAHADLASAMAALSAR